MPLRANLGCPVICEGWLCVDLHPRDRGVVEADAVDWLRQHPRKCELIKAFNLIEHLPNPGVFFIVAAEALLPNGLLQVRTDNAAWLPFYVALIHRWGWGAHASDKYWPPIMNDTKHYMVFSKLHLKHFGELAHLEVREVSRVTWGARLLATYRKP